MKEGVPRYILQTAFPERDSIPMFRQIRNFDEEATYLCPRQLVPLPIQDTIAAAVDIDITRNMVGLYRYSTGQFDQADREYNTKQAFSRLQKTLRPMEEFRGQSHEAILSNIMQAMDNLISKKGRIGSISSTASSYGILRPFVLLARRKSDLLKGDMDAMFPNKNEMDRLPLQQREIIAIAAYFTQWEALREAKIPAYSGENPFEPLLTLVGNGNVGISVDIVNGRNVYATESYKGRPLTNIKPLLAA